MQPCTHVPYMHVPCTHVPYMHAYQLLNMGLVDKFCSLLSNGPRPRYHAARALVYLGKLDLLKDFSLFEPTATGRKYMYYFANIVWILYKYCVDIVWILYRYCTNIV